jgi:multicomponent Na+:H+ antiporter subunit B
MSLFIDVSILILVALMAVAVVNTKNLLHVVIFSSVFSLLCALLYLLMAAPDVALTEASIGACVTTCFLLSALKYLKDIDVRAKIDLPALIVCSSLCALLCYASMDFHGYGDQAAITNLGAVDYYKNNYGKDTGLLSIVNAILASYRGFDTFGETLVIFLAGMSISLIFETKVLKK